MNKDIYFRQAKLMLQILPFAMRADCFALKGGTAINFFIRDLPRLSIDIDLAYIPVKERDESIREISNAMQGISDSIKRLSGDIKIVPKKSPDSDLWKGMIVQKDNTVVKIEPNLVIRGTVFPCEIKDLSVNAEKIFEMSLSVKTLSFSDLYGGKLCAALDRQHPRDLFDMKLLLDNEGLTDNVRKAFIVYLISHNRPIHELLEPGGVDIKHIFENEFLGMTRIDIKYEELIETKSRLIEKVKSDLTVKEKEFLLSFKSKEPDWDLFEIHGIDQLPAVRWKLLNLKKMPKAKHLKALAKLEKILSS